jgi:hypothetical protein
VCEYINSVVETLLKEVINGKSCHFSRHGEFNVFDCHLPELIEIPGLKIGHTNNKLLFQFVNLHFAPKSRILDIFRVNALRCNRN